jgi:phage protein D
MSGEKITLDSFKSLVQALEVRDRCADDYWSANRKVRELLSSIKKRQEKDRRKLSAMLRDLKAEEAALRRKVRSEAADRAKALLTGKEAKDADITAGARLAALPDEMAALETLIVSKRMTDEERELWEEAISELSESDRAYRAALYAYRNELEKWVVFFKEETRCFTMPDDKTFDRLVREGYELNQASEEASEDEEPGEDDEGSNEES